MDTIKYKVSIWFDGDVGPATMEYVREFHPKRQDHDAMKAELEQYVRSSLPRLHHFNIERI